MGHALRSSDFLGAPRADRRVGAFVLSQWTASPPSHHVKAHGHLEAHFMYVPPGVTYQTCASGARVATGANLIYNPPQTWHCDRMLDRARFFAITLPGELVGAALQTLPHMPTQIGNPAAHRAI